MYQIKTLLFLFLPFCLSAQETSKIERKKIGWSFFKNDRPHSSSMDAYVKYNIKYNYIVSKIEGDRVYLSFKVSLFLDTASSFMNESKVGTDKLLLNHEQGHVDIGTIYAQQLSTAFNDAVYYRNDYRKKVQDIFERIFKNVDNENIRYDLETNHGRDKVIQIRWEEYLNRFFLK